MSRKINLKMKIYKILKEDGYQNRINDFIEYFISIAIILNVMLIVVESIDQIAYAYPLTIRILRNSFFVLFLIEYIVRLWIADFVMHDAKHPFLSRIKYMCSFTAIINLLALFPIVFGKTVFDFRIFRILRLFRITQLKALHQYSSIFSKVLRLKGAQLISSFLIVLIFMLISSIIIYDIEYVAQPEVFTNILVAIWWSVSAITTVGYGDIYPITPLGRTIGAFISIFGVFIMSIPIGILSAGFFEISKALDKKDDSDDEKIS